MQCIKTGFNAYIEPYGEWVHGDAYETAGGELVLRICHRTHQQDCADKRHFTVTQVGHWFDADKTSMERNSTMVVLAGRFVNHGYEGLLEGDFHRPESDPTDTISDVETEHQRRTGDLGFDHEIEEEQR